MNPPKPNLRLFARLQDALSVNWRLKARPSQLPPPGDRNWLILSGRGWGKDWTGSNYTNELASTGQARRIALIAPTAADCRDVMVEGESGILAASPNHARPTYEPSKRKLTWPNGAVAHLFSAEEADRLRGPNFDFVWADELAAWNNAQAVWDMAMFCLRLGRRPRWLVTTTPRPLKLLKALIAREGRDVFVTRGNTYENAANLAPAFLEQMKQRYEGTRLGRQELNAELLEDVQGALWTREMLDKARLHPGATLPDMRRVVVSIDPSGTSGDDNGDFVGVVVVGIGTDNLAYVLADRTCKLSPDGWGRVAVHAFREFRADRIIAESNFGSAMVEHVIRTVDASVPYRKVIASRGKIARAEPVAALYEQNKVRHAGAFTELEDQACAMTGAGYLGDGSPDRIDALCWGISDLLLNAEAPIAAWSTYSASAPRLQAKSKFDGVVSIDGNAGFATSR